jgi:hypothetical protein
MARTVKLLFRPLKSTYEGRRVRLRWFVLFLLVILFGMSPWQCIDAVKVLGGAARDRNVFLVMAIVVLLYVVVAFYLNPIGTAKMFSDWIVPITNWDRGGRAVQWFQAQVWRIHSWLESRKRMQLGFGPDEENVQLRALFEIHNRVRMSSETKLKLIGRIASNAIEPNIVSAAKQMEKRIETEAGAAPDKAPDQS